MKSVRTLRAVVMVRKVSPQVRGMILASRRS